MDRVLLKGQNYLDSIVHPERSEWILMDFQTNSAVPKHIPWQCINGVVCLNIANDTHMEATLNPFGFTKRVSNGITHFVRREEAVVRMFLVNFHQIPYSWADLQSKIPRAEPCVLLGCLGVDRYPFKATPALLNMRYAATLPDCDSRRWHLLEPAGECGKYVYKKSWKLHCLINSRVHFCEQRAIGENCLHVRFYTHEPSFYVDIGERVSFGDLTVLHESIKPLASDLYKHENLLGFLRFINQRSKDGPGQPVYTQTLKDRYKPELNIAFKYKLIVHIQNKLALLPLGRLILHMGRFLRRVGTANK